MYRQFDGLFVSITLLMLLWTLSSGRVFRVGYISGSRRDSNISSYDRPGYQISGAISLAVTQINQHHPGKCCGFRSVAELVLRFRMCFKSRHSTSMNFH